MFIVNLVADVSGNTAENCVISFVILGFLVLLKEQRILALAMLYVKTHCVSALSPLYSRVELSAAFVSFIIAD